MCLLSIPSDTCDCLRWVAYYVFDTPPPFSTNTDAHTYSFLFFTLSLFHQNFTLFVPCTILLHSPVFLHHCVFFLCISYSSKHVSALSVSNILFYEPTLQMFYFQIYFPPSYFYVTSPNFYFFTNIIPFIIYFIYLFLSISVLPELFFLSLVATHLSFASLSVFYVFTLFLVQKVFPQNGKPAQELIQFHFTAWPDKSVPESPWGLVDFQQRVMAVPGSGPVLVHCR